MFLSFSTLRKDESSLRIFRSFIESLIRSFELRVYFQHNILMWFQVFFAPLTFPGSMVVKHPREMTLKCYRSVGSALYQKMRKSKLYIILKKIIIKGMTYTQTATKSINLFNAYERLKSPPPFTVHFLLVTRSQCFRFCA